MSKPGTALTFNYRKAWRTGWFWLAVLIVFVTLACVLLWPRHVSTGLDPESAAPKGAKALAEAAKKHGVDFKVARTLDELNRAMDAAKNTPTTLVIASSSFQSALTSTRIEQWRRAFAHLVIVDSIGVSNVGKDDSVEWHSVSHPNSTARADCSDPIVGKAETIALGEGSYHSDVATACFPVSTADKGGAVMLRYPRDADGGTVTLLANPDVMSNRGIVKQSHAVIALRLVSQAPATVWFAPTEEQFDEATATAQEAPVFPWLPAAIAWAILTAATLVFAAGRRFGRLVVEPLPVVVKAIETTVSRGRIYHKTNAREHSLRILQAASMHRLAALLALPTTISPQELAGAVAASTGRTLAEITDLLLGTATTDKQLVAKARALAIIEQEVRR